MRKLIVPALFIAAPLLAQGGTSMAGMNMDPTATVVGSGKLPTGWELRFDPARGRGGVVPPAPPLTAVSFETMGTGYHVKSGPAAIYYKTSDVATGEFTYTATFSQAKSMGHEAYGIFIGGSNLQDSTQSYLYFVIKPCRSTGDCTTPGAQMGEILINARSSNARPTPIQAAVYEEAVNEDTPGTGAAKNKLTIRVAKDSVHFSVNDKQVRAYPKSALNGAKTDGIVGVRVNHNLDLHISDISIKK